MTDGSSQTSLVDSVTQTSEEFCPPGEHVFHDELRAANLLTGFSKLYKNQEFVDVKLCVGTTEFPCHRNVLAVSSPYFMAMFSGGLAESQQEKITLQDMDSLTLSLVLDYVYTGKVTLTEDTVQNLLSAANLFQLISLREGCAEFMMSHVTVNNCIGVYFFARAHECDVLAVKAKEIINSKFSMLCGQQEFLALPADKLVEIVSDDNLNVTGEETVYEACMEWLNFDISTRFSHVPEVMKCVRFANISSYYFCDKIDHNRVLREDAEVSSTLDRIRYHHMLRNRQSEVDLNLMPRRGMAYDRGVMIVSNPYTEDAMKKYNSMEMLMPHTGEVVHICKLPQSLYTPAVAITGDNQIYMAGGALRKINYRGSVTTEGISNNLYLFDQTSATWTLKAKMHLSRSQFSLVIVDGFAYAIGGQDGTEILSSMEKYDPHTNTWMLVAPLPRPLRFVSAVSYRGKLYILGGEDVGVVVKSFYRYDPMEDSWTELPSMSTPRMLAGSVVYKDKIWIVGGNSAVSERWHKEYLPEFCVATVEIFDPATETWSFGPVREIDSPRSSVTKRRAEAMFRCLVWLLCLATYLLHCTGGHVVVPMTNKQLTEKVQKLEDLPEKVDQLSAAVQSMLQRLDDAHPTVTRCPDGWISHQSSCYGIGSEGVTWGAAQEFCELLGGGLAEMDSDEENEFVKGIARSRGYRGMWLGATDAFSDGNWVWASSRRRVSRGFTDWHANERTQNGGGSSEDCLLLARSLNYRWADAPCNWAVQFVCEIRLR